MNIIYFFDPRQSETQLANEIIQSISIDPQDNLVQIDICSDAAIQRTYEGSTPLIEVGPYHLQWQFSSQELDVAIRAAKDRLQQVQAGSREAKRLEKGRALSGGDKITYWFGKNYIWVFNGLVFLYLLLPFLAPMFARIGQTKTASVIYKIYSPVCHQMEFRSWFLFGDQAYYPRELADIPGIFTYEDISGQSSVDLVRARQFIGNDKYGYKVALCQRDVAIYGSILLFGIIFGLSGRKIKPLPWYWWVILGMIPIGLDGGSQLPGILFNTIPSWLIERESTPLLRTITGVLFGTTTMWYMYPLIEETMQGTRAIIATKMAVVTHKNKDI
jgi:uncharacterized membrane protein